MRVTVVLFTTFGRPTCAIIVNKTTLMIGNFFSYSVLKLSMELYLLLFRSFERDLTKLIKKNSCMIKYIYILIAFMNPETKKLLKNVLI